MCYAWTHVFNCIIHTTHTQSSAGQKTTYNYIYAVICHFPKQLQITVKQYWCFMMWQSCGWGLLRFRHKNNLVRVREKIMVWVKIITWNVVYTSLKLTTFVVMSTVNTTTLQFYMMLMVENGKRTMLSCSKVHFLSSNISHPPNRPPPNNKVKSSYQVTLCWRHHHYGC